MCTVMWWAVFSKRLLFCGATQLLMLWYLSLKIQCWRANLNSRHTGFEAYFLMSINYHTWKSNSCYFPSECWLIFTFKVYFESKDLIWERLLYSKYINELNNCAMWRNLKWKIHVRKILRNSNRMCGMTRSENN